MQAYSRVTVNTGILYVRIAITIFISLYTTRLILDALGASDFGIFSVVASVIGMLGFLNASMSSATQRFMSYAEGEGKKEKQIKIFNASIVLHFLIGILIVIVMEGAGYFLFNGILEIPSARIGIAKLVFHFAVVSTWLNVLSVPYNAVLNAHENMLFMAILEVLDKILRLGIALFITYSPYGYDKLGSFGLLVALISLLLLFIKHIYCSIKYEEVEFGIYTYYDKPLFKEMTSFASWSLLSSSTSMVSTYGQGIVLNIFFGPIVNASQSIANDVSGKLGSFSITMRRALNPVIDKSEGAGDRNRMLKSSILGGKISFFLLSGFAIPAIIEMPWILNIWLKNVPQYAIIFCQLLLIKDLIDQIFITLNSSIIAVGDIRAYKIAESVIHSLPLIFVYWVFHFNYPPYWLYIIFIIYAIFNAGVRLFYAGRVCGLSIADFLKHTVFRSFVSFGITFLLGLLPLLIMKNSLYRLLLICSLTAVILSSLVWIIGLKDYEKNIFKRLFRRIKEEGFSYLRRYLTH